MTFSLVRTGGIDPEVSAAIAIADRLTPLQDALGLGDLTVPEMQLFAMVCHHTGLDPFTRQIYAVKRKGKVVHQTGIDGYRSVAESKGNGQYAGSDEATFESCPCGKAPTDHPAIARVVVHRLLPNGHMVDQVGIARWHELYPGEGGDGFMWRQMPFNQLAKCAEANGLRKAFPRVLAGVYIDEEMQQANVADGSATVLPTAAERIAARRQAAEAPKDEPEGIGLSRDDFLAALERAGISQAHAVERGRALFDGVDPKSYTDEQRADLLTDLTAPDSLPMFTEEEQDALDAAVAAK